MGARKMVLLQGFTALELQLQEDQPEPTGPICLASTFVSGVCGLAPLWRAFRSATRARLDRVSNRQDPERFYPALLDICIVNVQQRRAISPRNPGSMWRVPLAFIPAHAATNTKGCGSKPGYFIADGWHGRLARTAGPLARRKGRRRT